MNQRVGILTLPLHTNYGGILQAAALYAQLENMGYEPVLMERALRPTIGESIKTRFVRVAPSILFSPELRLNRLPGIGPAVDAARKKKERIEHINILFSHGNFIHRAFPARTGPLYSAADMQTAVREYNIASIVVGSDQVWRVDYLPSGLLPDFFLGFAEGLGVRRISYAASFGYNKWIFAAQKEIVSQLLSRFDAVSVREQSGIDICRDDLGCNDAKLVLDPTLLIDRNYYDKITHNSLGSGDPYILKYILDDNNQKANFSEKLVAERNIPVQAMILDGNMASTSINDWVSKIKGAEFVITDSFHGMVLSIIFRKNFVAIINRARGADRFLSLANMLGLSDRLVDGEAMVENSFLQSDIDYDAVHFNITQQRAISINFLRQSLKSPFEKSGMSVSS